MEGKKIIENNLKVLERPCIHSKKGRKTN